MGEYTVEQERHRSDVAKLFNEAAFAVDVFAIRNRKELSLLSPASRNELIVKAALGYLIGNGLIALSPEEDWPALIKGEIPEHVRPDVRELIRKLEQVKGGIE